MLEISILNPRTLSHDSKAALGNECHPLAIDAFGTPMTIEDVTNHVSEPEFLLKGYLGESLVAFAACSTFKEEDSRVLLLSGLCIASFLHGKNILGILIDLAVKKSAADSIVARTQNPRLYRAIQKKTNGTIFPSPKVSTPEKIRATAKSIVKKAGLGLDCYDEVGLTFSNVYPYCLYKQIPMCKHQEVNDFFSQNLAIDKNGLTRNAMLLWTKPS